MGTDRPEVLEEVGGVNDCPDDRRGGRDCRHHLDDLVLSFHKDIILGGGNMVEVLTAKELGGRLGSFIPLV
jgi:hypothetical protein